VSRGAVVLLGALALAGCGNGHHTTNPTNKGSRPVAQPVGRGTDFVFKGGSGTIEELSNKRTSVSVRLAAAVKGAKAELDDGSCGTPSALRVAKALGTLSGKGASWSVAASLKQLTSTPLAFVLRSGAGKVLVCGQIHSA
jgi:hypothetical protein